MPDDSLTTTEAAAYLGVRPCTLDCWRSTGRYGLKFIKVGGRVRYRRAHLDEWLASRETTQVTPTLTASASTPPAPKNGAAKRRIAAGAK